MSEYLKQVASSLMRSLTTSTREQVERQIAADFVQHSPGVPPGRTDFLDFLDASNVAFPDGQFDLQDTMSEGQRVLLRWQFTGTHLGLWKYRPAPPTGRRITFSGMDLWRFNAEDKLCEIWFVGDMLSLMLQLGRVQFVD
jgi:predicted ester cyclase